MELRQKSLEGVFWSTLATGIDKVGKILIILVIARFISPEDLGIFGLAMVVFTILQALIEGAMHQTIVPTVHLKQETRNMFFVLSQIVAVAGVVGAGLISVGVFALGNTQLSVVILVLIPSVLLQALGAVQKSMLIREMRYKYYAMQIVVASVLSAVVGIVLAVAGWGVWSLVASRFTEILVSTLLVWLMPHSAHLQWKWENQEYQSIKKLYRENAFSILLGQMCIRLDVVVIGVFLGSAAVGLYELALRFTWYIFGTVRHIFTLVLLSAFSARANDPKQLSFLVRRSQQAIQAIYLLMFLLLFGTAPLLIRLLMGEQWYSAIPIIQALSAIALVFHWETILSVAFLAIKRPNWNIQQSILWLAVGVLLLPFGALFGLSGLALARVALQGVVAIFRIKRWQSWAVPQAGRLSEAILPIGIAVGIGVVLLWMTSHVEGTGIAAWLALAALWALGSILYTGIIRVLLPQTFTFLWQYARDLPPRPASVRAKK